MTERAYMAVLFVEDKEDETAEGVPPGFPSADELCSWLGERVDDLTKHEGLVGYRVLRIVPLVPGEPPPGSEPPVPQETMTPEQAAADRTGYRDGWTGQEKAVLPRGDGALADIYEAAWTRGNHAAGRDRA